MTEPIKDWSTQARYAMIRAAKALRASRGQPTDLSPATLDAMGIPPIECARTRNGYRFDRVGDTAAEAIQQARETQKADRKRGRR